MKKKIMSFLCLALSCSMLGGMLAGCAKKPPEQTPEVPAASESQSLPPAQSTPEPVPEVKPAPEAEQQEEQTLVYIGTVKGGFREYPVELEGELTADGLIDAMEALTGWNLTLADTVSSGKGGMAVAFSPECSLVTGPPDPQKEEFFAYDNYTLAQMILDSIQETLRRNFVTAPGDPANLDIWFSMADEPIEIEGATILIEKPWDEQEPFA